MQNELVTTFIHYLHCILSKGKIVYNELNGIVRVVCTLKEKLWELAIDRFMEANFKPLAQKVEK